MTQGLIARSLAGRNGPAEAAMVAMGLIHSAVMRGKISSQPA